MIKILFVVALIAGCSKPISTTPEEYDPNLSTWETISVPKKINFSIFKFETRYDNFMCQINQSDVEWEVFLVNGQAQARLHNGQTTFSTNKLPFETTVKISTMNVLPHITKPVSDGWICTYDRGEWGAAIYWFSQDGSIRKKLSEHHVKTLFQDQNRLFAIEGISHLNMTRGSIIEILKDENGWKVETRIKLPSSAEVGIKNPDGGYLIITSDEFLQANPDAGTFKVIFKIDWSSWTYPNSMVMDENGRIYIGMRQFVARYDTNGSAKKFDLLVPNKSWMNKKN